jgi:cytochrome c oxidase subunit 3
VSDAATFAGLFAAALVLRTEVGAAETTLSLGYAGSATAILLASSGALEGARRSERRRRLALLLAAGLGAVFLAGQLWEWGHLLARGWGWDGSARAATFYLLTGFHGVHVAAGVVYLAAVSLLARRELGTAAIYWHFVAAVWLVIVATFYVFS